MNSRIALVLLLFAVLGAGPPAPRVAASDATVGFEALEVSFPAVPDPFDCQLAPTAPVVAGGEPPTILGDLLPASAAAANLGEAYLLVPDAVTLSRVEQTVYLVFACLEAEDEAQLASLLASPDLATSLALTGLNPAGGRLPAFDVSTVQLLGLTNVLMHPDGRVTWDLTLRGSDLAVAEVNGALQLVQGQFRLVAFGPGPGQLPEAPLVILADPSCVAGNVYFAAIGPGLTRDRVIYDPTYVPPFAPPIAPELVACNQPVSV